MPRTPSRFRQFSLRTAAILFLFLTIAFGLAGRWIHDVRQRGEEQLRLVNRCKVRSKQSLVFGDVIYAPEAKVDRFTTLVRRWVHPEYARRFSWIRVSGPFLEAAPPISLSRLFGADDVQILMSTRDGNLTLEAFQIPEVKHLAIGYMAREEVTGSWKWSMVSQATELETLSLSDKHANNDLLARVADLPALEKLSVENCRPSALIALASIRNLNELHLSLQLSDTPGRPLSSEQAKIAGRDLQEAFDELANREKFTSLRITGHFPANQSTLIRFCAKSPLRELTLHKVQTDPAWLCEIAKLPALQVLEIDDPLLTDDDLSLFASAKSLKSILVGPNISGDAILKLREKLPNCQVFRK